MTGTATQPAGTEAAQAPSLPGSVRVEIEFHGPFRVSSGLSAHGLDDIVDRADPLPPSSLKGLMRASAARLLGADADLVHEVFGEGPRRRNTTGTAPRPATDGASPWHWGQPEFTAPPVYAPRARIAVDSATGAARQDFLAFAEEVWARHAVFTISPAGRLDDRRLHEHRTLLACAAAGVHALGADRRRGLGWVTLRPTDPVVDTDLLAEFTRLRTTPATTSQEARRA